MVNNVIIKDAMININQMINDVAMVDNVIISDAMVCNVTISHAVIL